MKDRRGYHREYYKRRKEALSLVQNTPLQEFTTVYNTPRQTLIDKGLTSLNSVKTIVSAVVLTLFIIANTAFLINEQVRFYVLKGYSDKYALFIALLCESAVILLSFFGAFLKSHGKSFLLYFSLVLTIGCILSVIYLGVEKSQSVEQKNLEIVTLMRDEIDRIKTQLPDKPKLASKLLKKEEDLRAFLQTKSVSMGSFETFTLAAIRMLSVFWNVIFSSLMAFFLKKK